MIIAWAHWANHFSKGFLRVHIKGSGFSSVEHSPRICEAPGSSPGISIQKPKENCQKPCQMVADMVQKALLKSFLSRMWCQCQDKGWPNVLWKLDGFVLREDTLGDGPIGIQEPWQGVTGGEAQPPLSSISLWWRSILRSHHPKQSLPGVWSSRKSVLPDTRLHILPPSSLQNSEENFDKRSYDFPFLK